MSHADIAARIAETERLCDQVTELRCALADSVDEVEAMRLAGEICRLVNDAKQSHGEVFVAVASVLRAVIPFGAQEPVWLGVLVQLITELADEVATHDGPVSVQ
jgi:hypothetical protein